MKDDYMSRLDDMDVELERDIINSKTRLLIWLDDEMELQTQRMFKEIRKFGKDLPINI